MSFTCLKCKSNYLEESEIVSLRCKHIFCCSCIQSHVISNLSIKIKCPLSTCKKNISDYIIRMALPEMKVEEYDKLCLETFAKNEENCFKCLLPECESIGYFNSKDVIFVCSSCKLFNCVMCNATHPFLNCKDYQKKSSSAVNNSQDRNELKAMKEGEFAKALKELQNFNKKKLLKICELTESLNLVPNDEIFTCLTCEKNVPKGGGIRLRNCFHMFCKDCLRKIVVNALKLPPKCAETKCKATLEDREIRGILDDKEYKTYYEKSTMQAKSKIPNVFQCKTPDCTYYGILEDSKIKNFVCPNCKSTNCVSCAAIHKDNETCTQYLKANPVDLKSIQLIEKEIEKGLSMQCPQCKSIIKKVGGCNWIQCPICLLELCWVLKIPRWGPKGRGDISGGCRCLVNNKKCDEKCEFGCMPE